MTLPNPKALAFIEWALQQQTDECILWPFPLSRGYARIHHKLIHRVVCERAHGAPFLKAHAAHRCDVKACINPRHLRWATPGENQADRLRTGVGMGERSGKAKLTAADVLAIRASTEHYTVVCERFGIKYFHYYDIRRRKIWRHL